MQDSAQGSVAFSHMAFVAALSVIALLGIVGWQVASLFGRGNTVSASNPLQIETAAKSPFSSIDWQAALGAEAASADPDGISNIGENVLSALLGSYAVLQESGSYSVDAGEEIGADIGSTLQAKVSYQTFRASDLTTDADLSFERMLKYRDDLRIALEPLMQNQGYELKVFANLIDSGGSEYATALQKSAANYEAAVKSAAKIVVPADAVSVQIGMLNSLSEFGAVVGSMTEHVDDPYANAALITAYTEAETRLFSAFDALVKYQQQKKP
ncbi:MAG: hypothetical protein HYS26_00555 [Candidatus Kaiserbacteria bacterium]|nr:MAG: hypothetical protein HYS26_00555 [Candidatus Kaiserbacteria bacterium]